MSMTSDDLFQVLGSGAKFELKKRKRPSSGRQQDNSDTLTSVHFFPSTVGPPARNRAATEVKRNANTASGIPRELERSPSSDPTCSSTSFVTRGDCGSELSATGGAAVGTTRTAQSSAATTRPRSSATRAHDEEIAVFRKRMGIRVKGRDVEDPIETFSSIPLVGSSTDDEVTRRTVLKNIENSEWKEPTPVQMQAVPALLSGRDVLATAPTGSGKTAAFIIPMVLRLGGSRQNTRRSRLRALVLAPTRELASQIFRDVVRLTRGRQLKTFLLTRPGASKTTASTAADQEHALAGYDIVVTTPMKLVALLRVGALSLSTLEIIVLDEADKLFEVGSGKTDGDRAFVAQVDEILATCSERSIQKALFSATISQNVSPRVWCRLE